MTLTRDSMFWVWTKIVGVAGLVTTGVISPQTLGLTDKQAHMLMAVCALILYLGGQLSTSTLPISKEGAAHEHPDIAGSPVQPSIRS